MQPPIIIKKCQAPDTGIVKVLMRSDKIRSRSRELRRNGFTFELEDTTGVAARCGGRMLRVTGVYEGTREYRKLLALCLRWHVNVNAEN